VWNKKFQLIYLKFNLYLFQRDEDEPQQGTATRLIHENFKVVLNISVPAEGDRAELRQNALPTPA
jgi:hypothetical protein